MNKKTLSLCLIVQNEAENLPRCLESAAPAADEIVVVDTGSTDATLDIARRFGARAFCAHWEHDFSQARNLSLAEARGEWILCLDADEELRREDHPALLSLLENEQAAGYYLKLINYFGAGYPDQYVVDGACRLFRRRPGHRFRGALHEEITGAIREASPQLQILPAGVRIFHYGYLENPGRLAAKGERNRRILNNSARQSNPGPFFHYALGAEYFQGENYPLAEKHFRRALEAPVVPQADLFFKLATSLFKRQEYAAALEILRQGQAQYPDFTDLIYLQGTVCLEQGKREQAAACYRRCLELGEPPWQKYTYCAGTGAFRAALALGSLLESAEQTDEALVCYERAVRTGGFRLAVVPLTRLWLKLGGPEKAREEIARLLSPGLPLNPPETFFPAHRAHLMAAEAFLLLGQETGATFFLRRAAEIMAQQPAAAAPGDYLALAGLWRSLALKHRQASAGKAAGKNG